MDSASLGRSSLPFGATRVAASEPEAQRNCVVYALYYLHRGVRLEAPITEMMVQEGKVDPDGASVVDPESGEAVRLVEALERGSVFATIITLTPKRELFVETFHKRHENFRVESVYDPGAKRLVSVKEALSRGLVDPVKGVYCHPKTGEISSLTDAMQQGLIQAVLEPRPFSLSKPFDSVHVRTIEEDMNFSVPSPPPDSVFKAHKKSKPTESQAKEPSTSGKIGTLSGKVRMTTAEIRDDDF